MKPVEQEEPDSGIYRAFARGYCTVAVYSEEGAR